MTKKIRSYNVITSDGFKTVTLYSLQDLDYKTLKNQEDLIDNILMEMRNLLTQFNEEDYYSIKDVAFDGLKNRIYRILGEERTFTYIKNQVNGKLNDEQLKNTIDYEKSIILNNINKLMELEPGVKYILQGNAILSEKINDKKRDKYLYINKNGFENILLEDNLKIESDKYLTVENNQYGMYIKAKSYIFIITVESNQSQIAQNPKFHNDNIHHLDPLFAYQLFKVIESNLSPAREQNQYKIDFDIFSKKIIEKLINKVISRLRYNP